MLLLAQAAFGQEDSAKWQFTRQFDFVAGWQTHDPLATVSMPAYLREQRRAQGTAIGSPASFDTITDNPLIHGASYFVVRTKMAYKGQVTLFADLYAEHRGVSYGIFNRNNTVVYPVLRLEAADTLRLFGRRINLYGKAGQFLNDSLDEGLTIYNTDAEGIRLQAKLGRLSFRYTLYGDFYNGIGLNIDDLHCYSIEHDLGGGSRVGLSWVLALPPFGSIANHHYFSLFAKKMFPNTELYAQAGYRSVRGDAAFITDQLTDRLAFLIGAKLRQETRKFAHSMKAELRYYGYLFNWDYYNRQKLFYRKPAADALENYANTVGNYLYPLRKFESPFSQWAVFTEYQGFATGSLSLAGQMTCRLSNKLSAFVNYDLNFLGTSLDEVFYSAGARWSTFIYPFFNGGLQYYPASNTCIGLSLTNRAMNLDLNYPTYYLLAKPCIQFSVAAHFD